MSTLAEAEAAFRDKRDGEAELACWRVLDAEPNHPRALFMIGVLSHRRGNYSLAQSRLERACDLEPGNAEYHSYLGCALPRGMAARSGQLSTCVGTASGLRRRRPIPFDG